MIVKDLIVNSIRIIGKLFVQKLIVLKVFNPGNMNGNFGWFTWQGIPPKKALGYAPTDDRFNRDITGLKYTVKPTTYAIAYRQSGTTYYTPLLESGTYAFVYDTSDNSASNTRYKITPSTTIKSIVFRLGGKNCKPCIIESTQNKYTLTYNANGGSGSLPSSQSMWTNNGEHLIVATNNLTKSGTSSFGWNSNSSGTGTDYSNGQSLSLTSNLTLYAKWEWVSYNIPAGTYTPSAFLNIISSYLRKGSSRTVKNSFKVIVNNQTYSVSAGSTIKYQQVGSISNVTSGSYDIINFGNSTESCLTDFYSVNFTNYGQWIVGWSSPEYYSYTLAGKTYYNYPLTLTTGISFN